MCDVFQEFGEECRFCGKKRLAMCITDVAIITDITRYHEI